MRIGLDGRVSRRTVIHALTRTMIAESGLVDPARALSAPTGFPSALWPSCVGRLGIRNVFTLRRQFSPAGSSIQCAPILFRASNIGYQQHFDDI